MARLKLTKEDTAWANSVKTRDGWACVICGSQFRPNAHHIIPRENHDFKYDIDNGLTLCPKHHMFSRIISAHNNPLAFFAWLEKFRGWQYSYCKNKLLEIGFND